MTNKFNMREELQRESKEASAAVSETKKERWDIVPREVSFTVTYDAPDGQCYVAELISIAPDAECRAIKARAYARLLNGLVPSMLPQEELLRLDALARAIAQTKQLPKWVEEWISCDNELLGNINRVLVEHETRFFRGNSIKSENGQIQPRVSINTALFEKAAP